MEPRHDPRMQGGLEVYSGKTYVLKTTITDDQREYINGIRLWLKDSQKKAEKIFKGMC